MNQALGNVLVQPCKIGLLALAPAFGKFEGDLVVCLDSLGNVGVVFSLESPSTLKKDRQKLEELLSKICLIQGGRMPTERTIEELDTGGQRSVCQIGIGEENIRIFGIEVEVRRKPHDCASMFRPKRFLIMMPTVSLRKLEFPENKSLLKSGGRNMRQSYRNDNMRRRPTRRRKKRGSEDLKVLD